MAELLIAAVDLRTQKKGEVIDTKPSIVDGVPWVWGNKEGLPNFIQLSIPDATREQVYNFLEEWTIKFQHEILNENAAGWRIKISVDSAVISASGVGKNVIKQKMRTYLEDKWGFVIQGFTAESVTFDVPKPNDLARLKKEFADAFNTRFDSRRYYFSALDVDNAVAAGGQMTLTKQQALNTIVDKFSE